MAWTFAISLTGPYTNPAENTLVMVSYEKGVCFVNRQPCHRQSHILPDFLLVYLHRRHNFLQFALPFLKAIPAVHMVVRNDPR